MTHEMPPEGKPGRLADLPERFLDLVLAEIDLAGICGGANDICAEGLGDGDEADLRRVASGAAGGVRDAFADLPQPCAERVHVRRYFLT
jgi:hypothetical protein